MIVERPRDLRIKKILAHGFLILFLAFITFPFLMVVSISFREGNFTIGDIWPRNPTLEHWYLAFGLDYTRADGTVVEPPFPVLLWMWNSIKLGLFAGAGVLVISTVSAYAFSRIKFRGERRFSMASSSSRCSRPRLRLSRSMRSSTLWARSALSSGSTAIFLL